MRYPSITKKQFLDTHPCDLARRKFTHLFKDRKRVSLKQALDAGADF